MNEKPESVLISEDAAESQVAVAPPDGPRGPFFSRTDWLSFGGASAVVFIVYLLTLTPEVGLGYSGMFAGGAMYAAVPFPAGFPVWTLYSWPFTVLLPWSNIAWRVAVASALAGALACGLVALMVARGGGLLLEGLATTRRLRAKEEIVLRVLCGVVAGLAFGFDKQFWRNAISGMPWSLGLLLFTAALALLMSWIHNPARRGRLYVAFLLSGLIVGTSEALVPAAVALPVLVVVGDQKVGRDLLLLTLLALGAGLLVGFFGPYLSIGYPGRLLGPLRALWILVLLGNLGLCTALIIETREVLTEWKAILCILAMVCLGLSTYVYLPITSMTNPPFNWGYPRTVEGFIHLITRGQFDRPQPTDTFTDLLRQVIEYLIQSGREFGALYLVLALVPYCFLGRVPVRERGWLIGLLVAFGSLSVGLLLVLNPPVGWMKDFPFFSASHCIAAVLAGYGLVLLGWLTTRVRRANTA